MSSLLYGEPSPSPMPSPSVVFSTARAQAPTHVKSGKRNVKSCSVFLCAYVLHGTGCFGMRLTDDLVRSVQVKATGGDAEFQEQLNSDEYKLALETQFLAAGKIKSERGTTPV